VDDHSNRCLVQGFLKFWLPRGLDSGADFLLTLSFWGGFRGVYGAKRPLAVLDLGPQPRTNSELGPATTLPTAHNNDAIMLEVRKGNSQNANNASVPDQLWIHTFAMGYGDPNCMARHSTALNQALDPQGRGLAIGDSQLCRLHFKDVVEEDTIMCLWMGRHLITWKPTGFYGRVSTRDCLKFRVN
jgi:hypothetical protein